MLLHWSSIARVRPAPCAVESVWSVLFCRILEQNKWCNGERRISSQRLVAPALCSIWCILCLQTAGSTWPTDLTGCGTCCRWPNIATTSGDTVDSSRYRHQECVDMFGFQRTWRLFITWCPPWVRSPAVEGDVDALDIYQVTLFRFPCHTSQPAFILANTEPKDLCWLLDELEVK